MIKRTIVEKDSNKYIPILDGIRAYAVLSVCLLHFFQVDESSLYHTYKILGIILFKISQLGLRGVELFLIISGFLITRILLESKNSSKYFTTFYARRFLRIFPLYYFVLFISLCILPFLIKLDPAGIDVVKKQYYLWTYTSNISQFYGFNGWDSSLNSPSYGHFWSLCVEEHFYLLWPILIFKIKDQWLPRIMWIIVFVSCLSVLFVYFFEDRLPISKWTTIRCAGVLSLGGLIAYYSKIEDVFEGLSKLALRFILPTGILFLLSTFIPRRFQIQDVLTFFSSALFFAMLLAISLKGTMLTNRLFNHNFLFFIGKISYGIYVYHGLLRPFLKVYVYDNFLSHISNGIISSLLYTILCIGISILIAWASWNILEKQMLKFKKVFSY